jgi:hypothetical protein
MPDSFRWIKSSSCTWALCITCNEALDIHSRLLLADLQRDFFNRNVCVTNLCVHSWLSNENQSPEMQYLEWGELGTELIVKMFFQLKSHIHKLSSFLMHTADRVRQWQTIWLSVSKLGHIHKLICMLSQVIGPVNLSLDQMRCDATDFNMLEW